MPTSLRCRYLRRQSPTNLLKWRRVQKSRRAAVGDGSFVYTITDNRITRLAIKTGLTDTGRIEVIAGLSDETPVVASTKGVPPPRTAMQPQMVREGA